MPRSDKTAFAEVQGSGDCVGAHAFAELSPHAGSNRGFEVGASGADLQPIREGLQSLVRLGVRDPGGKIEGLRLEHHGPFGHVVDHGELQQLLLRTALFGGAVQLHPNQASTALGEVAEPIDHHPDSELRPSSGAEGWPTTRTVAASRSTEKVKRLVTPPNRATRVSSPDITVSALATR